MESLSVVISSQVIRVPLGIFLPHIALVVHHVLQAVPMFVMGSERARAVVPRAPVLVQVLESGQVSANDCVIARAFMPSTVVLSRPL